MQKNIHLDNIERTFAKTGNEKFVLIYGKEKAQFWGTELGEDSAVKKQFMDLGVKPNMDVQIEYVEEPESFIGKDGNQVNWTKRTIKGIFKADGAPQPTMTPRQERFSQPNPLYDKPKEEPKNDKFWDMKAYKQCLWNYWLENQWEATNAVQTAKEFEKVWLMFKLIEQDANKRFFEFSEPVVHEKLEDHPEELPTIQVQEDSNSNMPVGWDIEGHPNFIPF